ncbi:MAG: prepilin-type N-terminal cleavage/methylation domain-containing protein [Candidatus Aureabacteria bacterium]|nr:prepilin-type N-terminal cleavage/methylation domain-containing protein [Candidatus Auribacterota bacterium]
MGFKFEKLKVWTKKGFTLLEVMVAVAILSLGLIIAIQSFSVSLRIAETSLNLSKAALLAQRKLSEIELEGFSFESLNSGDFGENYPDFGWETDITPVELKEPLIEAGLEDMPVLYQVAITIFWQERGKRRDLTFTTYLTERKI